MADSIDTRLSDLEEKIEELEYDLEELSTAIQTLEDLSDRTIHLSSSDLDFLRKIYNDLSEEYKGYCDEYSRLELKSLKANS